MRKLGGRVYVDALDILDELERLIEDARMMPMSASCLVNRAEAMELVHQLREALPHELRHASMLLRDRDAVIEESRLVAEQIVAAAQEERNRILAETDALEAGYGPAGGSGPADRDAMAIKYEANEYVDQQLAHLESILTNALDAVQHGRGRLRTGVETEFGPGSDYVPRQDYRAADYGSSGDYPAADYDSATDYGPATEYGRPAEYGSVGPDRRY
jgi:hypothetical protein